MAAEVDFGFVEPDASLEDVKHGLYELWVAVRARLTPEDSKALGAIHVGTVVPSRNEIPWAHTNHGEECVNLTIELKPGELELNLVGWKQGQSEALKDWLQSVQGELTLEKMSAYEVVAFARTAYRRTPDSRPYWQLESTRELGRCEAPSFRTSWITRHMVGLNPPKEKPAFHVRRVWRLDAQPLDGALVGELAAEVERLLVILREIWSASG